MSPTTDTDRATEGGEQQLLASHGPYHVYEIPVRLWHWITAVCIVVLAVTGYIIANPLPSVSGEASDHFLMGYIRFTHFAAAYIFAVAFIGRIYWAIAGNKQAREIFYLPLSDGKWWCDMIRHAKWILFIEKSPDKSLGHSPLAHIVMFFMFTLTCVFMILTGGAMYAEAAGAGSWQHTLFGWVLNLFTNSQNLHTWHHVGMWVIVIFVIVHVYTAIREEIMSRQSILTSMISGDRTFRDDLPQ